MVNPPSSSSSPPPPPSTRSDPITRRPTLSYPSVHLGSFKGLLPESLPPLPSSSCSLSSSSSHPTNKEYFPTRLSTTIPTRHVTLAQPDRHPSSLNHQQQQQQPQHSYNNISSSPKTRRATTAVSDTSILPSPSSSGSYSPTQNKRLNPPSLPPPMISLPPLPSLSPISPFSPLSPAGGAASASRSISTVPSLPVPSSMSNRSYTAKSSSSISSTHSRARSPMEAAVSGDAEKRSGSLSIHIPRTMTPPPITPDEGFTVRDSPSMARRRLVVQASPASQRVTSGRATQILDTDSESQHGEKEKETSGDIQQAQLESSNALRLDAASTSRQVELGSVIMPEPRVSTPVTQLPTSPHRLEKKASTNDLKNLSPNSPTPKRSLPRPPSNRATAPPPLVLPAPTSARPTTVMASPVSADLPRPPTLVENSAQSQQARSSSYPLVNPTSQPPHPSPRMAARYEVPLKSPDLPVVTAAAQPGSRHMPTKSASSIPVVGGLADAGPYPSASPSILPRNLNGAGPSNVGLGRPPQTGATPRRQPVQEEVCIECMMRDRDLADVVVSGEGVWGRKSDIAWEDLRSREEELMRSIGCDSTLSSSIPSLDHSTESDDEDSSLPSTNHSLDDLEARRRIAARTGRREQRKARRRQIDWRVAHEIGWRGFKWEEGNSGEGLPRGFRGCRGGPLTEDGIKAVMKKFPSASALRAKNMDTYLYHQAILVREIRAEAQRTGKYPEPGDVPGSGAVLSADRQSIIAGPRTSSVAWGQKHARELSEQMRNALEEPRLGIQAQPPSTVRQSPSSPADLANIGQPRLVQASPAASRPTTHFYPDREPMPAQRSPISINTQVRDPRRRSVNSTKTLDRSGRTDIWADTDEEAWPPISPAESGLRPFSFAVRAGAAGGKGSSDGHGVRKSLLGRWGGSVTSFFGGSAGGSGSMMDMHLGLDSDRQNRTSSNFVHAQPRAVSLASPTRPSFFGRDSQVSVNGETRDRPRALSNSISASRLSQIMVKDDSQDSREDSQPEKKKGFKGFLSKMKGKGHKKDSSKASRSPQSSRLDVEPRPDVRAESTGPLAPPPNMAYLADGRKDQNRNRSGSTSSMLTDNSVPRGSAHLPYGMRSVSAPQAGSSSGGSQSASPTSSRYRRESYASGREVDPERRTSGMEMLSGNRVHAYDGEIAGMPRHGQGSFPPHAFRPHNKTTSTFSNSSLLMPTVETPPPLANGANAFFPPPPNNIPHGGTFGKGSASPNRHKNLPPLPPSGQDQNAAANSPDSFQAAFPNDRLPYSGSKPNSAFNSPRYPPLADSPRGSYPNAGYGQSRASFDPLVDRPTRARQQSPRLAQSMYAQPSAGGSVGSFGQSDLWPPRRGQLGDDSRSVKSRKGLKSFFGGAKAGRVA